MLTLSLKKIADDIVSKGRCFVGRNYFGVSDKTMSREHGYFELHDGTLFFVDTSKNGTIVGSNVLDHGSFAPVCVGTTIQMGQTEILIV